MIKVLILAYDFPPYVSVRGLRPFSWHKYFREFGIDDIRIDTVPARRPLWYLSELELTITKAPTFTTQNPM